MPASTSHSSGPTLSPDARDLLLMSFLENVPDNVYFKDRNSRIIAVSASYARYMGAADAATLVGKTDFDLFAEHHARPAFEDEQHIIRTGQPMLGKLEKEVWPDGRVTWVLTNKLPLCDRDGATVGTYGVSRDVTDSKRLEEDLETARKDLLDAARLAGMAEVATGVLHNVGNVLTSLNVSNNVIATGLREIKTESLVKIVGLLAEHAGHLGEFLTRDPKGKLVPTFLASFAKHLAAEQARLLLEVESQQKNIDHIKEIVTMQQSYATTAGVVEPLSPVMLMEDSLRMNSGALVRHEVTVVREFAPVADVIGERGKVLQILINLIRNAKYALDECPDRTRKMTLRLEAGPAGTVRFIVKDNGVGIPPDNLARIFSHGFTTRVKGHGFGLHSSILAAREMRGTLTASSDGAGHGATFVLELPIAEAVVGEAPASAPELQDASQSAA